MAMCGIIRAPATGRPAGAGGPGPGRPYTRGVDAERPDDTPAATPGEPAPVEHLVLDIGGVVLPSAMPQVIAQLSALSAQSEQQLWRFFNTRLFKPFWSGDMTVDEFWERLSAQAGVPGADAPWRHELTTRMLEPLPGAARVRAWAERVPVGVLSNQRLEWVLPVLDRHGLTELFDPLLVSSLTGLVKPDPRAFAQLTRLGVPPERVLYVDDRPQALRRAEWHGVSVLQAHAGHEWMDRVDERLGVGAVVGEAT